MVNLCCSFVTRCAPTCPHSASFWGKVLLAMASLLDLVPRRAIMTTDVDGGWVLVAILAKPYSTTGGATSVLIPVVT